VSPNLMVFGIISNRKDDNIVGEVMDALDEYLEDQWDVVAWSRRSGTRFLVRANVEARGMILDPLLKARITPVPDLLEEIGEPRAKWLTPSKVKVGTPAEMAERTVYKWLDAMWPSNPAPVGSPPTSSEEQTQSKVDTTPAPTLQQQPAKTQAELDVLAAFGLTGNEVDRDGNPINMFVMGTTL